MTNEQLLSAIAMSEGEGFDGPLVETPEMARAAVLAEVLGLVELTMGDGGDGPDPTVGLMVRFTEKGRVKHGND